MLEELLFLLKKNPPPPTTKIQLINNKTPASEPSKNLLKLLPFAEFQEKSNKSKNSTTR